MLALRGRQSGESTPKLLYVRRNPLLMHIRPDSSLPKAWSAYFALLYWGCVTDRRKLRHLGSFRVANVTQRAICNSKLFIKLVDPSSFPFVDLDMQAKDDSQENAELAKESLEVCANTMVSDSFDHRINNDHLRA
jgi:hypothetical protein